MDYRRLGASGLKVPVLSFGAATFGGTGPLFGNWGTSDAREARRQEGFARINPPMIAPPA